MSANLSNEPALKFISPKCGAKTRYGKRCPNFAQQNGKCRRHGGLSTGPITSEGLERSQKARWLHGEYSQESKEEMRAMRYGLKFWLNPEALHEMSLDELKTHEVALNRLVDKMQRGDIKPFR